MEHEFEDYKEFFSAVGDSCLHPKFCGNCNWPVTIEQIYQAFKERMEAEQAAAETDGAPTFRCQNVRVKSMSDGKIMVTMLTDGFEPAPQYNVRPVNPAVVRAAPVEPAKGEKWHVRLKGAGALSTLEMLEVTSATILARRPGDYYETRYARADVEFVEVAAPAPLECRSAHCECEPGKCGSGRVDKRGSPT